MIPFLLKERLTSGRANHASPITYIQMIPKKIARGSQVPGEGVRGVICSLTNLFKLQIYIVHLLSEFVNPNPGQVYLFITLHLRG